MNYLQELINNFLNMSTTETIFVLMVYSILTGSLLAIYKFLKEKYIWKKDGIISIETTYNK